MGRQRERTEYLMGTWVLWMAKGGGGRGPKIMEGHTLGQYHARFESQEKTFVLHSIAL